MHSESSELGVATSPQDNRCVAGILVGGQSRRMGKTKLSMPTAGGRTLVEHVAQAASRARAWIDEILVLGFSRELPASLANLRILTDAEVGAGPLAGLCSLLEHADRRWGLLLACDMPLLESSLLERLWTTVSPNVDAVAYGRPDRPNTWHTCCALYHPRILPAAMNELKGDRSLQNLLASIRVTTLTPSPAERRMLSNVNTLQDYQALVHQA